MSKQFIQEMLDASMHLYETAKSMGSDDVGYYEIAVNKWKFLLELKNDR